jgi:hypothetical protein
VQVVFDAVIYLLQQHVLDAQCLRQGFFGGVPQGVVANGQLSADK